jgi:pimeloyl-ACP methyl ester carboxylesterase
MQNSSLKLDYKYHYVNGLTLHVGHLGPEHGEKLILLHGFPEFSYSWIQQADFFARQGYHVIVPDQRGYNLSKKPSSIASYRLSHLVDDVVSLIDLLAGAPVALAGHDWGGAVAWELAQAHPQLVRKLIILNMPHPSVMKENLRKNPRQMLRSWYAAFFQLPFLPEKICSISNYRWLENSLVRTARAGTFSHEYVLSLKRAWRQPGALTAMINWYRAFFRNPVGHHNKITVPMLLLWGVKDQALTPEMAEQSIAWAENGKLIVLENATHWLHHEEPELVNGYILAFLREQASS